VTIDLVHLVWAPLGPQPLRAFLSSYRAHPAGAEHELTILLNGAGENGPVTAPERELLLAELRGVEHRLIRLERPLLDLPAYGEAVARLERERVCFVNSYSVVLADGWLGTLARALAEPSVGVAGASGSWESHAGLMRGRLRHWPLQLVGWPRARREYPRFPNPHLRTNAFMLERRRLVEMRLTDAASKPATYLLESGRGSITRRIQAQGLRAVVVGRDGRVYDAREWPDSRTFRSGEQENLLVADNQTRAYLQAGARERRLLARDAWGRTPALTAKRMRA